MERYARVASASQSDNKVIRGPYMDCWLLVSLPYDFGSRSYLGSSTQPTSSQLTSLSSYHYHHTATQLTQPVVPAARLDAVSC